MRNLRLSSILLVSALLLTACSSRPEPRGTQHELGVSQDVMFFDSTANVVVDSVTMDFYPDTEAELPDPSTSSEQYVKVDLTITNTHEANKFTVNSFFFHLNGADFDTAYDTLLITEEHVADLLPLTDLEPGESASGSIYYLIASDESVENLVLIYEGFDGDSLEDVEYEFVFAK